MRALNGLWQDGQSFTMRYGETWKFPQLESACEACMLSVIGGSFSVLTDLRSSIIGRRMKDREPPRLARFVDGWTDAFTWEQMMELKDKSEVVGRELRNLRKRMHRARREEGRRGSNEGGENGTRASPSENSTASTGSSPSQLSNEHFSEQDSPDFHMYHEEDPPFSRTCGCDSFLQRYPLLRANMAPDWDSHIAATRPTETRETPNCTPMGIHAASDQHRDCLSNNRYSASIYSRNTDGFSHTYGGYCTNENVI
jgi:hypothetical protein